MSIDITAGVGALLALAVFALILHFSSGSIRENTGRAARWILIAAWVVLLVVGAVILSQAVDCTAHAQDRPRPTGVTDPGPDGFGVDRKLTALMATRVAINESSFAVQCVPWERRPRCVNDLGAILQRAEHVAALHGTTLYAALRTHSPRASGLCRDAGPLPRRCRMRITGNIRWASHLELDGNAPDGWYPTLPWSARRTRFLRTAADALRWLSEPWRPCAGDPVTWAGTADAIGPEFTPLQCGNVRNTFVARRRGSLPAAVARGDR